MFKEYNSQFSHKSLGPNQAPILVSQKENNPPFYISDPYYYKRYLESVPPEDSFFYFPKGDEIIINNPKKPSRSIRRIYMNIEYTDYELKALQKYKKIISKSNFRIPNYWTDADNVRFIYSTNFELEKAFTQMCDHLKWRSENFPLYFTPRDKVFEILNLGFAYIHGRDHQFRPIIVCQPYIYVRNEKKYSYDDWMKASVFICEYAANHMLIPGQIENWIMITNIRHVSMIFLPKEIRKVIGVMSDNFRAKLYINYIIGMSAALKFLYSIVVKFLDEITVKKLVIINDIKDGKILEFIRSENLEQQFGGSAPDLIPGSDNLFPPRMPKNGGRYLLDKEKKEEILISQEQYMCKMKNNLLDTVSPYVLAKIEEENKLKEQKEIEEKEAKEKEAEEERKKQIETERMITEMERTKDITQILSEREWSIKTESSVSFPDISNPPSSRKRKRNNLNDIHKFNLEKSKLNWSLNIM